MGWIPDTRTLDPGRQVGLDEATNLKRASYLHILPGVLGDHVCRRSTSMDNEYRLLGRTQLSAQGRRDLRTLTSTGQGHSGPDGAENDWSESDDDGDDAESRMMMLSNHEDEGQTFYWRETLHRSMESLSVNAMVAQLIFIQTHARTL